MTYNRRLFGAMPSFSDTEAELLLCHSCLETGRTSPVSSSNKRLSSPPTSADKKEV